MSFVANHDQGAARLYTSGAPSVIVGNTVSGCCASSTTSAESALVPSSTRRSQAIAWPENSTGSPNYVAIPAWWSVTTAHN